MQEEADDDKQRGSGQFLKGGGVVAPAPAVVERGIFAEHKTVLVALPKSYDNVLKLLHASLGTAVH